MDGDCLGALEPGRRNWLPRKTPKVFCLGEDEQLALTGRTLLPHSRSGICLELWDLKRGQCVQTIEDFPSAGGADQIREFLMTSLTAVCLPQQPASSLATEDGTLKLWDPEDEIDGYRPSRTR